MKPDIELSSHTLDMLRERNILVEWVWRTIENPQRHWLGEDGNRHFVKPIKEWGNRVLHVVINPDLRPQKVITVFFDRRLKTPTRK